MIFSGIPFLFYFLAITMLAYFAVPKCAKNTVLLIASLIFYGCGEPIFLILMSISILVGYASGIFIGKFKTSDGKNTAASKAVAVISIVILGGFLAYFKYADFFIENFNALTGLGLPLLRVTLPIGISFYTFQILSYTVDVYRGTVKTQRNLIDFATFVTMFPQLIAGPIVRYIDVEKELCERTCTADKAFMGVRRFIVGLSKKVLLANAAAELCDIFRASDEKSVLFYWMYAICFSLYVYFDFSGYSDMAIGIGHILGFNFPENFNYPYLSKSITEFWRRWHMTLGGWFRDYIYIPMGGNRVNPARWVLNIAVVWMFTGLWHGAAWNFVIWGIMFAVLLLAEKLFILNILKKIPSFLSHIYVLFLILISFIIFNADTMSLAFSDICGLFGFSQGERLPLVSTPTLYYLRSYAGIIIIGIIGSTPFPAKCARFLREKCSNVSAICEPVVMLILLLVSTAFLVDGSFNPFLYFRF